MQYVLSPVIPVWQTVVCTDLVLVKSLAKDNRLRQDTPAFLKHQSKISTTLEILNMRTCSEVSD